MRPRFPHRVTLRNPGPPSSDPDSGNDVPSAAEESSWPAWLAQRPVRETSFAEEDAVRGYTSSLYSLLLPPAAPLSAASQVVGPDGSVFDVEGDPATRYDRLSSRPLYVAAALRRLSDRQGA